MHCKDAGLFVNVPDCDTKNSFEICHRSGGTLSKQPYGLVFDITSLTQWELSNLSGVLVSALKIPGVGILVKLHMLRQDRLWHEAAQGRGHYIALQNYNLV
jgi:hypothetical protein